MSNKNPSVIDILRQRIVDLEAENKDLKMMYEHALHRCAVRKQQLDVLADRWPETVSWMLEGME